MKILTLTLMMKARWAILVTSSSSLLSASKEASLKSNSIRSMSRSTETWSSQWKTLQKKNLRFLPDFCLPSTATRPRNSILTRGWVRPLSAGTDSSEESCMTQLFPTLSRLQVCKRSPSPMSTSKTPLSNKISLLLRTSVSLKRLCFF